MQRFGTPATHVYVHLSVAATADGFLLVWSETEIGEPLRRRVVAQRFNANGLRVDGSVTLVESTGDSFDRTSIGCSTSSCLVTWREAEGRILAGRMIGHDAQPRGERRVRARERGYRDVAPGETAVRWLVALKKLLERAIRIRDRRDSAEIGPHGLMVSIGQVESRRPATRGLPTSRCLPA